MAKQCWLIGHWGWNGIHHAVGTWLHHVGTMSDIKKTGARCTITGASPANNLIVKNGGADWNTWSGALISFDTFAKTDS